MVGVAVIEGAGFTVTVAVIAAPGQPPTLGVIVYTAVPALVLVAVRVCAIRVPVLAEAPVTLVCVTVQLKVVPVTLLVKAMDVMLFEQMLCEEGVAVAEGAGFTLTVTTIGVPAQPAAVGVTVYTAVPTLVPVTVSVCVMLDPDPAEAPLAPVCVTVQAKVVPPVLLVSEIEVALPEQTFCDEGVAVTVGAGLTVTVAVVAMPGQPAADGVMV